MTGRQRPERTKGAAVILLMVVQAVCATFFVFDVVTDFLTEPASLANRAHLGIELIANLGLVAAIFFEGAYLVQLLQRQAHADRALSVASGALHEVMEGYFDEWKLTPSEADVAAFTIKGFTIAEIARLRGSAEGTVKTHLNAIYRKAGVPGRAQLVNLLIEELLGGPLVPADAETSETAGGNLRAGA